LVCVEAGELQRRYRFSWSGPISRGKYSPKRRRRSCSAATAQASFRATKSLRTVSNSSSCRQQQRGGHSPGRPDGYRGDGCVFGVAFRDPELDFWEIEFPPPSSARDHAGMDGVTLECASCHGREFVQQSDVETDVYAVNESILRHCADCGLTTNWAQARAGESSGSSPSSSTSPTARPSSLVNRDSLNRQLLDQEAVTKIALELLEPEPAPELVLPSRPGEKQNRRRDVRTRVNFTACVRHPAAGDEIVECDNLSRGGFSFRSQKQYSKDSLIQVALPYSPGSAPMFVFAEIISRTCSAALFFATARLT
jgi:hypothetical protein